jgi:hypothetical protein
MNHRLIAATATLLLFISWACAECNAQALPNYRMGGIRVNNGPVYSPYLNLLRGGSLVNNYYGLVEPQTQFYNSIQGLQQQLTGLQDPYSPLDRNQLSLVLVTGHNPRFLNTSKYYQNFGGSSATPSRNLQPLSPTQKGAGRGGIRSISTGR